MSTFYNTDQGPELPWERIGQPTDEVDGEFDVEYVKNLYPDSAGTATALYSGEKTYVGAIGVEIHEELVGGAASDLIMGRLGNDTAAGEAGDDMIFGGEGDDVLRGDSNSRSSGEIDGGNDTIFGGQGNDRIGGKGGNDELHGDDGDDRIWGDDGNDTLRGGLGDDILTGDDFSGGMGADTFILAMAEGTDTIVDFEVGVDMIVLDGLSVDDVSTAVAGSDTMIMVGDEVLAVLMGVVDPSLVDISTM